MSIYDKVYKAYIDSKKNNFWDAWGIVASPKTIDKLRAECMEHTVIATSIYGPIDKIFGLVIIPYDLIDDETVYVVDEQLGRTILGQIVGI